LEDLATLSLRGIEIYNWDIKDLTALSYLVNLEYIGLQTGFTKGPDFKEFEKLTHFFSNWRPKLNTVFDSCGLELLNIVNYPSEDLKVISGMSRLKKLQLSSRKLTSLNGIESLQSLEFLDLFSCFKLESLEGIEKCLKLKDVEVESCKKIENVSHFGELVRIIPNY